MYQPWKEENQEHEAWYSNVKTMPEELALGINMVFYLFKLDQYFKSYELFEFNSNLFLLFQAGP